VSFGAKSEWKLFDDALSALLMSAMRRLARPSADLVAGSMNTSNVARHLSHLYPHSTHTMPGRTRPIEKFVEATAKCSPEVLQRVFKHFARC
jgi:hypothetical protein